MGEIPPEMGALIFMTSYIFFGNWITGPIPTSLGLIKPLKHWMWNRTEWTAPSSSLSIGILQFLASNNNFDGNVSSNIGRWTQLQNLWFVNNKITGTILIEIWQHMHVLRCQRSSSKQVFPSWYYREFVCGNQTTVHIPSQIDRLDRLI